VPARGAVCDACGFDTADYSHQDLGGTVRSLGTRWRWMLEGVPDEAVAAPPPDGHPVAWHLDRTVEAFGLDPDGEPPFERMRLAGRALTKTSVDDLRAVAHAGTHHLHLGALVLRAIGAGVAPQEGRVARLHASGGGVPKLPVTSSEVGRRGMAGDRQATRRHHGRVWQALSLWSAEVIDALRAEGHPIAPGCGGENVTVAGLDWGRLRPGGHVRLGGVVAELSAWADPCTALAPCLLDRDVNRVAHDEHPGWSRLYATVLKPGAIRVGDPVIVEPERVTALSQKGV
jgi:MOSC domain-containing protein YiiM